MSTPIDTQINPPLASARPALIADEATAKLGSPDPGVAVKSAAEGADRSPVVFRDAARSKDLAPAAAVLDGQVFEAVREQAGPTFGVNWNAVQSIASKLDMAAPESVSKLTGIIRQISSTTKGLFITAARTSLNLVDQLARLAGRGSHDLTQPSESKGVKDVKTAAALSGRAGLEVERRVVGDGNIVQQVAVTRLTDSLSLEDLEARPADHNDTQPDVYGIDNDYR